MSIQYIADGYNCRNERVVLWRTGEYTYELEFSSGLYKTTLKFYETEYYEALEQFNDALNNYQNLENV